MWIFKTIAVMAASLLILVATPQSSPAATAANSRDTEQAKTLKWWVGAWEVTFQGDEFERHYTLESVIRPEEKGAPPLILRCEDGRFTAEIIMILARTSEKPYAIIFAADNGRRAILPMRHSMGILLDPIRAEPAETLLVNAKRLGVRLKFPSGRNFDAHYSVRNVAVGKPQLFNICPPRV